MSRRLVFTAAAWEDYLYWQGQDRKTLKRINLLVRDTLRDPFTGVGKPEPLREWATEKHVTEPWPKRCTTSSDVNLS